MRILVATDSFGGFRSAPEASTAIAEGLAAKGLQVDVHPMSDGGEGFLDALHAHRELQFHGVPVLGPIGRPTFATAGRLDETWVVESATAMGLHLCGDERMPGRATSAGLGTLLAHLARKEEGPFILGLGGSATVDAGLGMLQELGLHAIDEAGKTMDDRGGATALTRVRRLVGPPPLQDRVLQVLCDVQTPLFEAAATYGPQKGVHREDIEPLTEAHIRWADTLNRWRDDHGMDPMDTNRPGGGAAGGVGFAAAAVVGGHLVDGARTFSRLSDLDRAIHQADAVVTGEGRMDPTTFFGKVAKLVIERTRNDETMVFALVGQAQDVPAAPEGPDHVVVADSDPDREVAFLAAIDALAAHLLAQRA
jgi:glycerate kinase